tara:strand:+ start:504 stop:698 length:195 start_codon:yes stop_codon:yes gene_type:complete
MQIYLIKWNFYHLPKELQSYRFGIINTKNNKIFLKVVSFYHIQILKFLQHDDIVDINRKYDDIS